MTELLCFYADTVGDTSRQVGEMLWLLQETKLNQIHQSTMTLVLQSEKLARDDYLEGRLNAQLKRITELIEDQDRRTELLSHLILARKDLNLFAVAIEKIKQILALCVSGNSYEREAKAERDRIIMTQQVTSKSTSVVMDLERYCTNKDWQKFSKTFAENKGGIVVVEHFYCLVQIGLLLVRDDKFELCESILEFLFPCATPSCAGAFNHLNEQLVHKLSERREWERAAAKLEFALAGEFQTLEFKNRLRVQLSEIMASNGNLLRSTVLLYQAFSEVPEPGSNSRPPLLL